MMLPNVTLLGDSRIFDTYYTNSHYGVRYGYDKTFPHVWRRAVLAKPVPDYDVVHIPDHFRGGTLQNNIVRVCLTDPAIVVVLDGIWESLLNKGHYLEYAQRKGIDGEATYDRAKLAPLFRAGELSLSPVEYGERQRQLVSYFRRRHRHLIWMTLPVPPKSYLGSTYHAGDYAPIPDWDECLAAINGVMVPIVNAYGGSIFDMTKFMTEFGGADKAFIDQWHFSESFHAAIAVELDTRVRTLLPSICSPEHISHRYILGGSPSGTSGSDVVLYSGNPANELMALQSLPAEKILLYPDELGGIDNPRGDDRLTFGKQTVR
jgi:hypothetical protein